MSSSNIAHMDEPLDIEAQDKATRDRNVRARNAVVTEQEDIKWMLSSRRGRRILWRMLDRAGVFKTSFNQNSMAMAFAEGARNEGLRLLSLIMEAGPEHYTTMVKEARE